MEEASWRRRATYSVSWADVEKLPDLRRLVAGHWITLLRWGVPELLPLEAGASGVGFETTIRCARCQRALVALGWCSGTGPSRRCCASSGAIPSLLASVRVRLTLLARQSRPRTVLERDLPGAHRSSGVDWPRRVAIRFPGTGTSRENYVRRVVEHEALVRAMFEDVFAMSADRQGAARLRRALGLRRQVPIGEPDSTGAGQSRHRRALGPAMPDWGRHETHGVDAKSTTPGRSFKTWFGYGLHLD